MSMSQWSKVPIRDYTSAAGKQRAIHPCHWLTKAVDDQPTALHCGRRRDLHRHNATGLPDHHVRAAAGSRIATARMRISSGFYRNAIGWLQQVHGRGWLEHLQIGIDCFAHIGVGHHPAALDEIPRRTGHERSPDCVTRPPPSVLLWPPHSSSPAIVAEITHRRPRAPHQPAEFPAHNRQQLQRPPHRHARLASHQHIRTLRSAKRRFSSTCGEPAHTRIAPFEYSCRSTPIEPNPNLQPNAAGAAQHIHLPDSPSPRSRRAQSRPTSSQHINGDVDRVEIVSTTTSRRR